MKIIKAITSGFQRSARASKQILVVWLINTLAISLLIVPFRNLLVNEAGNSMAPDLLKGGTDLAYWLDLMPELSGPFTGFMIGLLALIGVVWLLGVFLSGGLFDTLRANSCGVTIGDFFKASAQLFFPYLWVTLMVTGLIIISALLLLAAPAFILQGGGSLNEELVMKISEILRYVFMAVLLIWLLVADYARAWLAAADKKRVFRALGYGFRATFTTFFTSFLFILFAVALQALLTWGGVTLTSGFQPETGGGLFLLFLLTSVLLILRIFMRTFRYGGITSLYTMG
ncbi:MAG: hypothetical protein LC649_09870 [Bacteroidales bacterium]|nr:hypothetical protein [Bacteroidales bacterium]